MEAETVWFGLAAAATLGLTFWRRRAAPDPFIAAIVVSLTILATNMLNYLFEYPYALWPYPVIDALAGCAIAVIFCRRPRAWNILLSSTFVLMGYLHVMFHIGQVRGDAYATVRPYMDNLSDTVKVQLALIHIPGGVSAYRWLRSLGVGSGDSVLRRRCSSGHLDDMGKRA